MSTYTPYFVGIAGGSGSGKTTLARKLKELAKPGELDVIYIDSYYRARHDISLEQRQAINYDHPDALEFDLLVKHLEQLQSGQTIEIPRYNFALHNRDEGYDKFDPRPVVLLEGILALYPQQLRQFYSDTIFVDNPDEQRLARRIERDVRERGRTRESVIEQWQDSVQPAFQEFCLPTKQTARLIVNGAGDYVDLVQELLRRYRVEINF